MSNELKPKDFVNYVIEVFNIKTGTKVTIIDITNEINSFENPFEFVSYSKNMMDNEKYQFKSGLQKFQAMAKDYKASILKQAASKPINLFVKNIFERCTSVMYEVQYQLQIQGRNIAELKNYRELFDDKQIEVLDAIGGKEVIYELAIKSPSMLESKIRNVVALKALIKLNPSMTIDKPKSSDALVLQNIVNNKG